MTLEAEDLGAAFTRMEGSRLKHNDQPLCMSKPAQQPRGQLTFLKGQHEMLGFRDQGHKQES